MIRLNVRERAVFSCERDIHHHVFRASFLLLESMNGVFSCSHPDNERMPPNKSSLVDFRTKQDGEILS